MACDGHMQVCVCVCVCVKKSVKSHSSIHTLLVQPIHRIGTHKPRAPIPSVMLLYLAAIAYLPSPAHLSPRASVGLHRAAAVRLSDETPPEDWRELRARLVAKERAEDMGQ